MYYVYIIKCGDNTLYTGITVDIKRRFKEHQSGKGGAYTRSKGVKRVLYIEKLKNRSLALKREAEIKKWPHDKKSALVNNYA